MTSYKHQEKIQKPQPPWESSFVLCRKFCKEKKLIFFLFSPSFSKIYKHIVNLFFPSKKRNAKLLTTAHSSLCNLSYRQVSHAIRKFRMIKLFYHPPSSAVRPFLLIPSVYLCIWLLLLESWQGFQGRLHSSQIHLNRCFPSWCLQVSVGNLQPVQGNGQPFPNGPATPGNFSPVRGPWICSQNMQWLQVITASSSAKARECSYKQVS